MPADRNRAWETTINEFFTHLTTLSSGSIVVISALSPGLDLAGWVSRSLAIVAVVGFVVTIATGLGAKLVVAKLTAHQDEDSTYERGADLMAVLGGSALMAFAMALLALAALAIKSFIA